MCIFIYMYLYFIWVSSRDCVTTFREIAAHSAYNMFTHFLSKTHCQFVFPGEYLVLIASSCSLLILTFTNTPYTYIKFTSEFNF